MAKVVANHRIPNDKIRIILLTSITVLLSLLSVILISLIIGPAGLSIGWLFGHTVSLCAIFINDRLIYHILEKKKNKNTLSI